MMSAYFGCAVVRRAIHMVGGGVRCVVVLFFLFSLTLSSPLQDSVDSLSGDNSLELEYLFRLSVWYQERRGL